MELPALTAPAYDGRGAPRRATAIVAAALAGLVLLASAGPGWAAAKQEGEEEKASASRTTLVVAPESDVPPPGRRRSSREVIRTALAVPEMRRLRRENPGSYVRAFVVQSPDGPQRGWQVSVFRSEMKLDRDDDAAAGSRENEREIGQVILDDDTGRALEAWTGFQVEWTMARGYPGAFGRKVNASYVWIALILLFLAPFLRPPWRLLHLDLLVLCAFSISYAVFGTGRIGISVPLVYPCLVYLLVRMLAVAWARSRALGSEAAPAPFHVKRKGPGLRLLTPPTFLAMGVIFLLGFRLGLNISASNVIDVGYSGVIGADLLTKGETLYDGFPADNERGDTYGPVNYLFYVPFEQLMPWKGVWDELPAAHGAAVAFDLASAALLWLLGRRLRGPGFGLLLSYLWLAFPFTILVSNSNANDSLVSALVLATLLVVGRPVARGVAVAAAGLTKFAPLLLGPLVATFPVASRGGRSQESVVARAALTTCAGAVAATVLLLPAWLGDGGIGTFLDRTLGFQGDRASPFSIWGYAEGDLDVPQRVLEVGVVVLALVVAFVPRRRDLVSLAALSAAVLLAVQLVATHWFYLYVVWFFPLVLVAVLADHYERPDEDPASASASTPVSAIEASAA